MCVCVRARVCVCVCVCVSVCAQALLSDSIASASIGRLAWQEHIGSCKREANFTTRKGNVLTRGQVRDSVYRLMAERLRVKMFKVSKHTRTHTHTHTQYNTDMVALLMACSSGESNGHVHESCTFLACTHCPRSRLSRVYTAVCVCV